MRIILAILFLLSGVLIYYIFRSDVVFLLPIIDFLPTTGFHPSGLVENVIAYNLPDALWYAALLLLQPNPLIDKKGAITLTAILLPYILEGMQAFNLIAGTFDWLDLIFYTITLIIFFTKWKKEKIYLKIASSNLAA